MLRAALAQPGWAAQLAPWAQDDKHIILAAIAQSAPARPCRSTGGGDAARSPAALECAAPALRADRDCVLAAVRQRGLLLQCAAPALRADRDCVLAAVAQCGPALVYAAPELRGDKAIVLAGVSQGGAGALPLGFAARSLRADPDVVRAAVRRDPFALQDASAALRRDPELLRLA